MPVPLHFKPVETGWFGFDVADGNKECPGSSLLPHAWDSLRKRVASPCCSESGSVLIPVDSVDQKPGFSLWWYMTIMVILLIYTCINLYIYIYPTCINLYIYISLSILIFISRISRVIDFWRQHRHPRLPRRLVHLPAALPAPGHVRRSHCQGCGSTGRLLRGFIVYSSHKCYM